ncbi:MAG: type IV-A pilus assembly ATPase PilB [bacterium]
MPVKQRKSLGESLVEQKIISEEQLKSAIKESEKGNEPLRKTLVKLGLVSEEDIVTFFEEQLGIPRVDLRNYLIDAKLIALIPENIAKKHTLIPLFKTGDTLTIATADPLNVIALDEVKLKTKSNIEPAVATESEVRNAINQYYGISDSIENVIKSIDMKTLTIEEGSEELEPEKLRSIAEEAPIIKLVNLIILQAIRDKASDIHVEPEEDGLQIRFRVDGILHEQATIPKQMQAAVLSRIKIMSEMNIATKRIPQDGRFRLNIEGGKIDLRVSSMPTIFGENIVMRLLDTTSILIGMEKLGFDENNFEQFKSLIVKPYGIILVTGPTGSGKTTTLYSALNSINTPDKNIITVEDPVEYQLRMIRQSQINLKAGFTFATGLRSILRQDPDVIMVGEIRDLETAEISVQAALTGHLVFSTLHTNDAPGSLTRLIDMGVEPFLISSSVIGIIAQRLVRTICTSCKQSYTPSSEVVKNLGVELPKNPKFYKGTGCKACKNTGFKGRIGIFEMLLMNDKVRNLLLAKTPSSQIKHMAQEDGMKTLREDGVAKALAGVTTIDEVVRVTQE